MRFEDAYEGWTENRLIQIDAAQLLGVCPRTFRGTIGALFDPLTLAVAPNHQNPRRPHPRQSGLAGCLQRPTFGGARWPDNRGR